MVIRINRQYLKDQYTIGKLYIDDEYFCDTIEDAVRAEKVPDKTAIPYGIYDIILSMSDKFKRVLPLVLRVENFTGIRIHRGNSAEDSSGCIIIGENKLIGKVINSTKYETELIQLMLDAIYSGESIRLEIT